MTRDEAIRQISNWILNNLHLEGGPADKWFRTDEFSLELLLQDALVPDSEGLPDNLVEGLLDDVGKWINAAPFREIKESDVDCARRVGRMNGLDEAARFLMDKAVECFKNRKDDEAFFLRDKAREIRALVETGTK